MTLIADSHLQNNDSSEVAMPYLQKAIALKADSAEARIVLARALLKKGTVEAQERAEEEATIVIESKLRDSVLHSNAYTLRGIIYYKQGHYQKALEDFNHALDYNTANQSAFENKRATLARLNNDF